MQYTVRKAKPEDLDSVVNIYAYARSFMARNGNPHQWGRTNPPIERTRQDLREEILYVVTKDEVVHGVFVFFVGDDPTYENIYEGNWSSHDPYGVIHRVAGDGSGGIFAACVDYCAQKCSYLRVDTHHDNRPMQRVIEKAGFRRCGIIYIADGSPRIAYDRVKKETADIF